MLPAIYLGFNTNPKNGRVKALSKASDPVIKTV